MVRASFGIYNTIEDVNKLIAALSKIIDNKEYYIKQYHKDLNGDYHHNKFQFSSKDFFSLTATIDKDITSI